MSIVHTSEQNNGTVILGKRLYGRKEIYTNAERITAGNVLAELNAALAVHTQNRADICYLYDYLRGKQPIIDRVKKVNAEITNRVVVNRASEIITFKTANFVGEPIQYVSRGANKSVPEEIEKLNSMMLSENKPSKDMSLAYWMFTAGVGYRLVLNDKALEARDDYDEAPFEIYTLDSRNAFVVRRNDVTRKRVMGVTFVFTAPDEVLYTVYTPDAVYKISGSLQSAAKIVSVVYHNFGMVPIFEYPCNALRMGAFEVVIDLLDAINTVESNRLDGVEQFIQALMIFKGTDISREDFLKLKDLGAISLPPTSGANNVQPSVEMLNEQLDQGQTQILVDALYQEVLQIVGMPSQGNANTSDSSNNGAVIMKNGWWNAEARAKETIGMWKEAETDFLKMILKICRDTDRAELKISDIEQKFGRNSYEDLLVKTQSFATLINAKCPPIQAYTISNVVTDPEAAAMQYQEYEALQEAKEEARLEKEIANERLRFGGQNDTDAQTESGAEA